MSSTVAFFFFKQKTAYEMRISDWSSDVCSSDLVRTRNHPAVADLHRLLPAPVAAVEHEAARRLDRTAEEDRLVEWFVMFDLELVEHRSEEHTSELQSLMRNSYAVFCLKKKKKNKKYSI